MTSLQGAPFYLRAGGDIRVRSKACNKNGCGLPCAVQARTIKLTGTPTALNRPRIKSRVGKQIVLEWDSLPNASFELWYRQEVAKKPDCVKDSTQIGCSRKITGTKATSFQLNNLETGNVYWFKLRAISANCGPGDFSQELQVNMAVRPAQIALDLKAEGCNARATWELPNDGGARITKLTFQVRHSVTIDQKATKNFVEKWDSINLPKECQSIEATSCLIPFTTLMAAPYSLPINAVVYARVSATNSVGTSEWSIQSRTSKVVRVFRAPSKMAEPKVTKGGDASTLKITWAKLFDIQQTGGRDVIDYDLHWDAGLGPNSSFRRLIETKDSSYTKTGLDQSRTYRFQVRARNSCSSGPFSGNQSGDLRQPPKQMESLTCDMSPTQCASVITWIKPESIGSAISKYEITVRGKDLKFYPLTQCNSQVGLQLGLSCTVPMSVFSAKPFNLPLGEMIYARGRAFNTAGWSNISISNARGCSVRGKPAAMTILEKLGLPAVRSLDLTWPNTTKDAKFEIVWDKGDSTKRVEWPLDSQNDRLYQSRAGVYGLEEGKEYRFRIRRKDICGTGDFSKVFTFTTAACPNRLKTAVVKLVGTNVEVTWDAPVTNANAPVLGYQIVFKKKNGSWFEFEKACFGKDPQVIKNRKCIIPMLDDVSNGNGSIQSLTGLQQGDLIQVMVRGFNKHCRSNQFSPENTTGQNVVGCPSNMATPTANDADITRTSINVNWKNLQGTAAGGDFLKITQFELQWRKETQSAWIAGQSFQTSNLDKTHSGLTNKGTYLYRVRAKNIFCWGGWSTPDLKVQTGSRPGIPNAPTAEIVPKVTKTTRRLLADTFTTKHEIKLCWTMVNLSEEKEVASYEVVFQTNNSRIFKENKAVCDGKLEANIKEKCCRLPMSTFWEGEYRQD